MNSATVAALTCCSCAHTQKESRDSRFCYVVRCNLIKSSSPEDTADDDDIHSLTAALSPMLWELILNMKPAC